MRNNARPVAVLLCGKGNKVGSLDIDEKLVTAADLVAMKNYGYDIAYHGIDIGDGIKKSLMGYAQYVGLINIGFAAFDTIGAQLKVYSPHITEFVTIAQKNVMWANGVQVFGDGDPSRNYSLTTDFNIPQSYDICGHVIGLNMSLKRHARADKDTGFNSTTALGWTNFLKDLNKVLSEYPW